MQDKEITQMIECPWTSHKGIRVKKHVMVDSIDVYGNVIKSCKYCGTGDFSFAPLRKMSEIVES